MKKQITTLFLIGFTLLGFSQDSSKTASIKTLLEVTGSGKLGVQVVQNMLASYKQSLPNVPQDFWDNLIKELKPEVLIEMIIPIYDKYYTADEIKKLIEFYQTPLGKKLISVMPQIMQESMQTGQAWGEEVGKKVYKNLTEKGYVNETE